MANCDGAMADSERSKIRRPVREWEYEGRVGMLSTGCAQVDQLDGSALFGQQPDAGAVDVQ